MAIKNYSKMRTIDKIITECSSKYGAPMGRTNVSEVPKAKMQLDTKIPLPKTKKIFDCRVPMVSTGEYDKGGAYWGLGAELRVRYTKDLSFIEFYRVK